MKQFNHLHLHSSHSLIDGMIKVPELVNRVKGHKQKAVAITDHGSMGSIPTFFKEAHEQGIKPIAGIEAYICENRKAEGGGRSEKAPYYHITLLASGQEGYSNLCRLSTLSFTEGFYYKPRIDLEVLREHSRGIICLSGCVGGWPQVLILNGKFREAMRVIGDLRDIFKDRFFLEIMRTGEPDQEKVLRAFESISSKEKIPMVVTGDAHYTDIGDHDAHDTLFCMGLHKAKEDPTRLRFLPKQYHIKSTEEMWALGLPKSAYHSTELIEEMCESYELPKAGGLPRIEGSSLMLEQRAYEGLFDRYETITDNLLARLSQELATVRELNYETYFLIVEDFVRYARDNDIFTGWGRGSAGGSLLSYCLRITNIDPIAYELFFERFLNASRREPPDIDTDFPDTARERIVEYIREKYGQAHVGQIASYGTYGIRQSIIDVCKCLEIPKEKVDSVLKGMPYDPTLKIPDALANEMTRNLIEGVLGKDVVRCMEKFDQIPRTRSVHSAGLIIDQNVIEESLPMGVTKGQKVCQYDYDAIKTLGYEKFDVLGVRTLRVIAETCKMVGIDPYAIPIDDELAYKVLSNGHTIGVFQAESYGYRKFLQSFRPKDFKDVMMVCALYRPGPMQGGRGLEKLVDRRFGRRPVEYPHPSTRELLAETYGIMVYQEQVMGVVQVLAGWTLQDADLLRHAIGKKKAEEIKALRKRFIADCMVHHSQQFGEQMFAEIEFFARYGWNKAHAASYGMVTYATAFLKANFPKEYMCCLLNSEIGDPERVRLIERSLQDLGVRVLHPRINVSGVQYSCSEDGILSGLGGVKFLGGKSISVIIEERKRGLFASLEDFRKRVAPQAVNSRALDYMTRAKCFVDMDPAKEMDFLF